MLPVNSMEPQSESKRSIHDRRRLSLAPLRTDLNHSSPRIDSLPSPGTRNRLRRPRPTDIHPSGSNERVPLSAQSTTTLERQPSRSNLKYIFTRNKNAPNHDVPQMPTVGTAQSAPGSRRPSNPFVSPIDSSTSSTSQPSRSTSIKSTRSQASKPKSVRPSPIKWEPPPLFQAYPQAVRHACLSTPQLSADSILRISTQKKNALEQSEAALAKAKKSPGTDAKKATPKKHKTSDSIGKTAWSDKIFMLVTSGWILQYSADGNFDRRPEKMMQLGPSSAAFASDAIPGWHWVLQVSQRSDADGMAPAGNKKGLLSRFGFQSSDARRYPDYFFLVFKNAEDMNSWLVSLRKQIATLGGEKYVHEQSADEANVEEGRTPTQSRYATELRARASVRALSIKPASRGNSPLPPSPATTGRVASPVSSIHRLASQDSLRRSPSVATVRTMNRLSTYSRYTNDLPSPASTITPHDPDLLKDFLKNPSKAPSSVSLSTASPQPSPMFSPTNMDAAPGSSSVDATIEEEGQPPASTRVPDLRSRYAHPNRHLLRENRIPGPTTRMDDSGIAVGGAPNFSVPSSSRRQVLSRSSSRSQASLRTVTSPALSQPASPTTPSTIVSKFSTQRRPSDATVERVVYNANKRQSIVANPIPSRVTSPGSPGTSVLGGQKTRSRTATIASTANSSPPGSVSSFEFDLINESPTSPSTTSTVNSHVDSFPLPSVSSSRSSTPRIPRTVDREAKLNGVSSSGDPKNLSQIRRSLSMQPKSSDDLSRQPPSDSTVSLSSTKLKHSLPSDPSIYTKTSASSVPAPHVAVRSLRSDSHSKPDSGAAVTPIANNGSLPPKQKGTSDISSTRITPTSPKSASNPRSSLLPGLTPRKSAPDLSRGPPSAPPPNCPLPEVPSEVAARFRPAWSGEPPKRTSSLMPKSVKQEHSAAAAVPSTFSSVNGVQQQNNVHQSSRRLSQIPQQPQQSLRMSTYNGSRDRSTRVS